MNFITLVKGMIRHRAVQIKALRRPSIRYCVENDLLASIFVRTPSEIVRQILNLPVSESKTQLNQDIFALLMNQFRPGFFIEIGANDGFTLSNTLYLEENFGWKGILVEPNPKYIHSLRQRRNSLIVDKAIAVERGKAEFIDAGLYGGLKDTLDGTHVLHTADARGIMVDCISLPEILDLADVPRQINFISIDVEGGELPIVEQMVSLNRRFKCGCIEYNGRISDYKRMVALLNTGGYQVIWEHQTEQDLFFVDGIGDGVVRETRDDH